jgi:hypothetical protein
MKEFWKELSNSRLVQYLIYGLVNIFWWYIVGFEFAILMAVGIIMGEICYQDMTKK